MLEITRLLVFHIPTGPSLDEPDSRKRPAPVVHHALLLGASPSAAAATKKRARQEDDEGDSEGEAGAAANHPPHPQPMPAAEGAQQAAAGATAAAAAAQRTDNQPSTMGTTNGGAATTTTLYTTLPGGTQGIRAPMLARNWVRRLGNRVQGKPGTYMCVFLDKDRIPATIVTGLEKTIGYDPALHDPVVFFDRRGRRLVGSFGAVLGGTGQLWGPEAFAEMSARDASAAWAFQGFLEGEAFHWLECEQCGKWRMYPHEDVLLPGEGEGGVFVCAMAGTWNPAVRGCETEQEFSFDSMVDGEQVGPGAADG